MNAAIKWMVSHSIAAWLIMVSVVVLGVAMLIQTPQKTFPDFDLDAVSISVSYPGASPLEIQESVVRPIEDQISGVDGIDEVTANISEGRGGVAVSFVKGTDIQEKLDDIKSEVDRITVFPDDANDPIVVQADNSSRVLEIVVHGAASERVLKEEARRLKNELVLLDPISSVEVANTRDYEISIEIERDTLQAYGLTMQEVAGIIAGNSLELPGGSIDTDTLNIPIRTTGRNYTQSDFESLVIRTTAQGGKVYLRDIAKVVDGFEDADLLPTFNGEPSVSVNIFRVGEEQVLTIAQTAKDYIANEFLPTLEPGISATVWQDDSEVLQGRIDLLVNNAYTGLILVVICLALFLDFRLAFWSAVGIGVSFAATFIVLPYLGVSINMMSLFGFILAIGIVVDNAIVVSENIYKNGEDGLSPPQAAERGTQRIAVPVIFSTLTTLVAFWPLLQLPGVLGKFLSDIPTVVMVVLTLSMLQALFILPKNLANLRQGAQYRPPLVLRVLRILQWPLDRGLRLFINGPLDLMLRLSTRYIYVPIAIVASAMALSIALLMFGYVKFEFFPSIDGDFVTAKIEMAEGTTFNMTEAVAEDVRKAAVIAARDLQDTLPQGAAQVLKGQYAVVGAGPAGGGPTGGSQSLSSTLAHVVVQLADPEVRDWPTSQFEDMWRAQIGDVAGIDALDISASLVGAGEAIALEMSLPEGQDIQPIVEQVEAQLQAIPGVFDIRNDASGGRLEYKLALKEEARVYGLTLRDLAIQTRNGFFGVEATTVQRGQDNVGVFVRFPQSDRDSLADLLDTLIATPSGQLIPLSAVAQIEEGSAPSEILRRNGRQITTITADVDPAIITNGAANGIIDADIAPPLLLANAGLIIEKGGEQRTQGDSNSALGSAFGIAMAVIYGLLALIFRSFVQPIVVMLAIPLGLIGAILGHYIMGISLGLLSIFGIIGLAGVVINNSLVMVDMYNENLDAGMPLREAVIKGTKDRFRPILLTSVTTFLGIYPLITETSIQAQFLVPLAVSIGYGVLFGTAIIILAVPSFFILQAVIIDLIQNAARAVSSLDSPQPKAAPDEDTSAQIRPLTQAE